VARIRKEVRKKTTVRLIATAPMPFRQGLKVQAPKASYGARTVKNIMHN
jgi:hypothetical protein